MDWMFAPHSNSCVETLKPNMVIFGSGAFGKWLHLAECTRVWSKQWKSDQSSLSLSEKAAICKLRKRPLPRTKSAGSLILDFTACGFLQNCEKETSIVLTTQSIIFCYNSLSRLRHILNLKCLLDSRDVKQIDLWVWMSWEVSVEGQ